MHVKILQEGESLQKWSQQKKIHPLPAIYKQIQSPNNVAEHANPHRFVTPLIIKKPIKKVELQKVTNIKATHCNGEIEIDFASHT